MNPPYRLSAEAEEDVIGIWLHIAEDNPRAADRVVDGFHNRLELLSTQPRSGPLRDDLGVGIRCLVIGQYLAFYRIEPDEVTILRVLHGKREIGAEEFG